MMAPRSFLFTRTQPLTSSQSQTSNPRPKSKPKANTTPKSNSYEEIATPNAKKVDSSPSAHNSHPEMPLARATAIVSPPATTSEPVIIPARTNRRASSRDSRQSDRKDVRQNARKASETTSAHRARDVHCPDAIPPSVAALLAITAIPQRRPSSVRRNQYSHQRLTVDAVLRHTSDSEKDYSLSLGKSPLDLLLSPPEDECDDETLGSDMGMESYLSARSVSTESVPSLDESSIGDSSLSLASLGTPGSARKRSVTRRRLQPVSSPPRESAVQHPLSESFDVEALDFRAFEPKERKVNIEISEVTHARRKSAFKSNLTASLKALRSAARSFSNLTTPAILPEDFLTRSIITIDPRVPFTDERMPPRLEDTPTPALRRYLNPTTNAPIEAHVPSSLSQTTSSRCTASIQMQTYKVSKIGKATSPSVISRRTATNTPEEVFAEVAVGPVARQRDMRENSDFIRIAVMEMLMRRNGKLDDKLPGRAKWALPPRKPSTKPYEIGEGGVPSRWVAVAAQ